MSTDRQKSFTARLSFGQYAVSFYELTLEASSVTGNFRGVERTVSGASGYPNLKATGYLCLNNKLNKNEGALLYFRYENDGYVIYVREPGPLFGKYIGISNGYLFASDAAPRSTFGESIGSPITFPSNPVLSVKLVSIGNYDNKLTLDDFSTATNKDMCMQGPRGVLQYYNFIAVDNSFSYSYLVTHGGTTEIAFSFEIIEKNVGYLNNPEEV